MSTKARTVLDPAKIWKSMVFPVKALRQADFFSLFIKVSFALCSLAFVSLCFYLVFSGNRLRFPCSEYRLISTNLRLPSAAEHPTNVTHILFGIGGSSRTWEKRHRYSDLWWRPNATRGFVWLDEKPPQNAAWPATSPPYKVSANTSRFLYTCSYGYRSAIRMARIVKESFELGLPNVRWFVMGDDDTVFFLDNLITVLNKYDHNQMYYIGGNSESVEQVVVHSYAMAYGGGGFAISYPLAAELVRLLDGCIDRYASFYGSDLKIQGCISEIGVPVTKELGFHQVDVRGNPYGLLAAHPVAPLVSLHHLDYVEPIFPETTQIDSLKKLMTAFKKDPNRALQQTFCYDLTRNLTVSISWGYTIQVYPWLLTAKQLETPLLTFKTWATWSKQPFTFDIRSVSKNPCRRPLVYFLDRVYEFGSRRTLTKYRRHVQQDYQGACRSPGYSSALAVRLFDVSATKMNSDIWKMAPRRQCCEVINGGNEEEGIVEVKISGCKPYESLTPP